MYRDSKVVVLSRLVVVELELINLFTLDSLTCPLSVKVNIAAVISIETDTVRSSKKHRFLLELISVLRSVALEYVNAKKRFTVEERDNLSKPCN